MKEQLEKSHSLASETVSHAEDVHSEALADGSEPVLREEVKAMLLARIQNRLTPREQAVFKLLYGLEDGRLHTRKEVSEVFGITCERVRLIESEVFRRRCLPRKRLNHKENFEG